MNTYDDGGILAFLAAYFFFFFMIFAVTYVVYSVALMGIFKKAGVDAWKAWVPFVQGWTFTQLGGYTGALSLIGSFVTSLFFIIPGININKAFGKDGAGWIVLMILLQPVWLFVLGYGDAQYRPERLPSGHEHVRAAGVAVNPAAAAAPYGQVQPQPYAQPQAYGQGQPQAPNGQY